MGHYILLILELKVISKGSKTMMIQRCQVQIRQAASVGLQIRAATNLNRGVSAYNRGILRLIIDVNVDMNDSKPCSIQRGSSVRCFFGGAESHRGVLHT